MRFKLNGKPISETAFLQRLAPAFHKPLKEIYAHCRRAETETGLEGDVCHDGIDNEAWLRVEVVFYLPPEPLKKPLTKAQADRFRRAISRGATEFEIGK